MSIKTGKSTPLSLHNIRLGGAHILNRIENADLFAKHKDSSVMGYVLAAKLEIREIYNDYLRKLVNNCMNVLNSGVSYEEFVETVGISNTPIIGLPEFRKLAGKHIAGVYDAFSQELLEYAPRTNKVLCRNLSAFEKYDDLGENNKYIVGEGKNPYTYPQKPMTVNIARLLKMGVSENIYKEMRKPKSDIHGFSNFELVGDAILRDFEKDELASGIPRGYVNSVIFQQELRKNVKHSKALVIFDEMYNDRYVAANFKNPSLKLRPVGTGREYYSALRKRLEKQFEEGAEGGSDGINYQLNLMGLIQQMVKQQPLITDENPTITRDIYHFISDEGAKAVLYDTEVRMKAMRDDGFDYPNIYGIHMDAISDVVNKVVALDEETKAFWHGGGGAIWREEFETNMEIIYSKLIPNADSKFSANYPYSGPQPSQSAMEFGYREDGEQVSRERHKNYRRGAINREHNAEIVDGKPVDLDPGVDYTIL